MNKGVADSNKRGVPRGTHNGKRGAAALADGRFQCGRDETVLSLKERGGCAYSTFLITTPFFITNETRLRA